MTSTSILRSTHISIREENVFHFLPFIILIFNHEDIIKTSSLTTYTVDTLLVLFQMPTPFQDPKIHWTPGPQLSARFFLHSERIFENRARAFGKYTC